MIMDNVYHWIGFVFFWSLCIGAIYIMLLIAYALCDLLIGKIWPKLVKTKTGKIIDLIIFYVKYDLFNSKMSKDALEWAIGWIEKGHNPYKEYVLKVLNRKLKELE